MPKKTFVYLVLGESLVRDDSSWWVVVAFKSEVLANRRRVLAQDQANRIEKSFHRRLVKWDGVLPAPKRGRNRWDKHSSYADTVYSVRKVEVL